MTRPFASRLETVFRFLQAAHAIVVHEKTACSMGRDREECVCELVSCSLCHVSESASRRTEHVKT